jgi:6-pyruvoyltetrahydropterin/6-carboxytetrahydropterin synthase
MVRVTSFQCIEFWATHVLRRPSWTERENLSHFGPCCNPNGHGHNFLLTIGYYLENDSHDRLLGHGYVADYLSSYVMSNLHMNSLNEYIFITDELPTCEHVIAKVYSDLLPHMQSHGIVIKHLGLKETRNNEVIVKFVL